MRSERSLVRSPFGLSSRLCLGEEKRSPRLEPERTEIAGFGVRFGISPSLSSIKNGFLRAAAAAGWAPGDHSEPRRANLARRAGLGMRLRR